MTSLMRTGGPVTLTRGQFGATAAAKKPGASYQGYLGYIARRRAARLGATNADPLGQTGPSDVQSTVNRFAGMYGNPTPDAQIQTQAQGLIDPIVAAITGSINTRAKEASGAIGTNSAALAKALAGQDYGAPYTQGKTEQAAVDAALQQSLAGGGAQLAGDLQSRLGQINDPTVAAAAGQVAAQGTAAGNTELARGSSSLSNLIAQAAAAKSYGQKLPGIAQLTGLQDIAGVQRDATNQIGTQTADVQKMLPGIVQNFRSENANLTNNKASAAAQIFGLLTGQNITKATAKAGLITDATKLSTSTMPVPDSSLSNSFGYQVDQYGQPVGGTKTPLPGYHLDKSGNVVKDRPAAKPGSTLAPKDAIKLADDLRYGVQPKQQWDSKNSVFVDVPNTGQPNASYNEAYNQLVAAGLPPDRARSLVNSRYKPGEFGRPYATKRAAFKAGSSHRPATGQTQTDANGDTYVWNGTTWVKK